MKKRVETLVRAGKVAAMFATAFAALGAASAAPMAQKAAPLCHTVRATEGWHATGLTVRPDQLVCVRADGLWSHGGQGIQAITPFYGPEGFAKDDPNNVPEVVSRVGALIAKIGENGSFVIERQLCFIPEVAGQLQLSMNDDPGTFENNAGAQRVAIALWPASTPLERVRMHPPVCRSR